MLRHGLCIKGVILLISLYILIMGVCAYDLEYQIYNFNTLNPINGASIIITNDTFILSNTSNSYGYGLVTVDDGLNLTASVVIDASGYDALTVYRNYTSNDIETFYLNPSSTDGIVRIPINDLTFSEHNFCMYYSDNMRLDKCYNGTQGSIMVLHINTNYTIVPFITNTDLITSPSRMGYNIYMFVGILFGGMVLAVFLGLIIGILLWMIKKVKR